MKGDGAGRLLAQVARVVEPHKAPSPAPAPGVPNEIFGYNPHQMSHAKRERDEVGRNKLVGSRVLPAPGGPWALDGLLRQEIISTIIVPRDGSGATTTIFFFTAAKKVGHKTTPPSALGRPGPGSTGPGSTGPGS